MSSYRSCGLVPETRRETEGVAAIYVYNLDTQWVTVHRMYNVYNRIQMNICCLLRKVELERPRPLRRVVGQTSLGYWHPFTTDMYVSGFI